MIESDIVKLIIMIISPIAVTLVGITMVFKLIHSLNALSPVVHK